MRVRELCCVLALAAPSLALRPVPARAALRRSPLPRPRAAVPARGRELVAAVSAAGADEPAGWRARLGGLTGPDGRRSLSVFAVLIAAFLNLLGFTMAGPITPALGAHFGVDVGASLGFLSSAYPLGMLCGIVLWPALSDRVGRKPVISLSLFGSGLGLAAQGYAVRQNWPLHTKTASKACSKERRGGPAIRKPMHTLAERERPALQWTSTTPPPSIAPRMKGTALSSCPSKSALTSSVSSSCSQSSIPCQDGRGNSVPATTTCVMPFFSSCATSPAPHRLVRKRQGAICCCVLRSWYAACSTSRDVEAIG